MNNSLLIEVFARILFSFTHGVTEHYDPEEPEAETFGYNDSLSGEGREWNCYPVDKPICQEYSPPSDDYYDLLSVGNSRVRYRVIGARRHGLEAIQTIRSLYSLSINVHRRINFTFNTCHH